MAIRCVDMTWTRSGHEFTDMMCNPLRLHVNMITYHLAIWAALLAVAVAEQ